MSSDAVSRGHFDDAPVVELLSDGRRVRLAADFGYVDRDGARWDVPQGAVVDGASIPQPLWSVIGGPFEGMYRSASIVHDWYCDLRSRPWHDVHRMFHDAMLTSGVSAPRAMLMYGGVYWGGPRWSDTVVENTQLILKRYSDSSAGNPRGGRSFHMNHSGRKVSGGTRRASQGSYRYGFTAGNLQELGDMLAAPGLELRAVEEFVDGRLRDALPLRI
jgi:hypothetical protein